MYLPKNTGASDVPVIKPQTVETKSLKTQQ
jgi:hypothetical protein